MIDVLLNGEATQIPEACTVEALVASLLPSSRGVAVAIDRELQPRSTWAGRVIAAGEHVEVVTAAAGG